MSKKKAGRKQPRKPAIKFPRIQARYFPKEGLWRFRGRLVVDGRQKVTGYFDTQRDAFEALAEIEVELSRVDLHRLTIAQAGEAVLKEAMNRGQTREQAVANYGAPITYIKKLCDPDTPVGEIRPEDVNEYINLAIEDGRATNTIKEKDLPVLSKFFRIAGVPDATKDPKVRKLRLVRRETEFLEMHEVHQILDDIRHKPIERRTGKGKNVAPRVFAGREWHADIIEFVVCTGIRAGELGRLTLKNVNWERNEIAILIAKDRANPRKIEITDELEPVVRRLCDKAQEDPEQRLVPGGMDFAALICKRWRDRLKSKYFTMRILRHSFGSALIQQGIPLSEVADLMGHSQVTTTNRYVHATSNRDKRRENAGVISKLLKQQRDQSDD